MIARPAARLAAAALALALPTGAARAQQMEAKAAFAGVVARAQADPNYKAAMRERFMFRDDPLPADKANLDSMLAAGDDDKLLGALNAGFATPAAAQYLNWERRKVFEGGPLFTTILYTRDLWRMAEPHPEPRRAQLRETALSMALYAYAQIAVDSAYCADATAGDFRREQLRDILAPLWNWALTAPAEVRERAKFVALATEFTVAPVRAPRDNLLCQGRPKNEMVEIAEGLAAANGKPLELAPNQNSLGKTYMVPRAPAKFVSAAEAGPKQDRTRAELADQLETWLKRAA